MVFREAKLVIKNKNQTFFHNNKNNNRKKSKPAALRCQPRYFFSRLAVGLIVPS